MSKRVVLYYDDEYDPEIAAFLARVPARRLSHELRKLITRGLQEDEKKREAWLAKQG